MLTTRRGHLLRAMVVVIFGASVALALTGCSEDDVEKELGRASSASVEAAYDVDTDPLISGWLNYVGQTMVSHCRRQNLPYEFKVIDTGMVNAFAAPYGHIYVTRGFLDFVGTEDEVWMVVGHEVGHVVNRDSIKSLKRTLIWSILNAILTSKSQTGGEIAGIGLGLLSLRYSRTDEYDADDSGTLLAYRAGYDPHMGVAFFDRLMTKLEKRRPSSWEVYFMTHPPTERRIARQMKRGELAEDDAEVLMQIGRGYMRRAHPARAVGFLSRAADLEPGLADVQTVLGDAYAARGEIDLAREHYQAALDASSGNTHAETQLAALAGTEPWSPPGMAEEDQERAGSLLARVDAVGADARAMRASAASYDEATSGDLLDLRGQVKGINSRLIDLGEQETDLTEGLKRLLVRGGASVARATESVYVLDSVSEDFEATQSEMDELVAQCRARLEAAQRGEGDPSELPALRSAVTELRRATGATQRAMEDAPATIQAVSKAQSSAANTTSLLEQLVRVRIGRDLVAERLRSSSRHTTQQAVQALQAVRRAKRQTTKARGHALVARLNLLGAGAGPYLEGVMDQQVSHFLMCPTQQVRALRADGVGYGEAAAAIAAGRSLGTRPSNFLIRDGKPVSPIVSAMSEGAALHNANVMLKFLAAAMAFEREADEAAGEDPA